MQWNIITKLTNNQEIFMGNDELSALKLAYAPLISLCKGGDARTVAVSNDKVANALDEREFCAICVANEPIVDFYLKLFDLQSVFLEQAPPAPNPCTTESATIYLEQCLSFLKNRVRDLPDEWIVQMAREALAAFGSHFSGKLIHSDAQGASMLVSSKKTRQPHASSRSLATQGILLEFDQSKNDNKGIYQRIIKVIKNNPIFIESNLPDNVVKAIHQGVSIAIEDAKLLSPKFVDHRIRQTLVPSGNGYISLSPLVSGGFNKIVHDGVDEIMASMADMPTAQIPVDNSDEKLARAVQGASKGEKRRFSQIHFPVGGAKPINASLFSPNIIQKPYFFSVPQRNIDLRNTLKFIFSPVYLFVTKGDIKSYGEYLLKMHESIRNSSTGKAVEIESKGFLRKIVFEQHFRLIGLASTLLESPFIEDGVSVEVTEDLLRLKRKSPPSDLDVCIVNQNFGDSYVVALSAQITQALFRKVLLNKEIPLSETDRHRINLAAQCILRNQSK